MLENHVAKSNNLSLESLVCRLILDTVLYDGEFGKQYFQTEWKGWVLYVQYIEDLRKVLYLSQLSNYFGGKILMIAVLYSSRFRKFGGHLGTVPTYKCLVGGRGATGVYYHRIICRCMHMTNQFVRGRSARLLSYAYYRRTTCLIKIFFPTSYFAIWKEKLFQGNSQVQKCKSVRLDKKNVLQLLRQLIRHWDSFKTNN